MLFLVKVMDLASHSVSRFVFVAIYFPHPVTYVLEASVEYLQLPLAEVGLGLQLLEALRPVAHHSHLQVVIDFV